MQLIVTDSTQLFTYVLVIEARHEKTSAFFARSDTNMSVKPQKMARGLQFRIQEEERFCYLCSANIGVVQVRGYRAADPCLCFRIYAKSRFSNHAAYKRITSIKG